MIFKAHYSGIEYWKAYDRFRQQHCQTDFLHTFDPTVYTESGRGGAMYYVTRPWLTPAGEWELQTAQYTETELEQWHYYHLTGVLDGSDYGTGDEEWQENISVIVLARNEEEAWQLSGYRKGAYWMWGPDLRPIEGFDDELWVIAERFKSRVLENMGWILERFPDREEKDHE